VCHKQLGELRARLAADEAFRDVEVYAIDPHERWAAKSLLKQTGYQDERIDFPLLLDPALVASAKYGVPFQMRIHVEQSNRPATFVIDREGILRFARRATTFSDRPTPDEVLAVLRSFDED